MAKLQKIPVPANSFLEKIARIFVGTGRTSRASLPFVRAEDAGEGEEVAFGIVGAAGVV